jgi:hypothetical protein
VSVTTPGRGPIAEEENEDEDDGEEGGEEDEEDEVLKPFDPRRAHEAFIWAALNGATRIRPPPAQEVGAACLSVCGGAWGRLPWLTLAPPTFSFNLCFARIT